MRMDTMQSPDEDLTTPQVAAMACTSRATVSRALKSGELLGIRDNAYAWHIRRGDAEAWIARRAPTQQPRMTKAMRRAENAMADERVEAMRTELVETRMRLVRAESEAQASQARLTDALADRDAWKALAERLSARPAEIVQAVPVRPSFFTRLFKQ
jgi:hypothetical protein